MIASTVKDPWSFLSVLKQRVSDFFKTYPAGTYDEFLDKWPRAHQVDKNTFNEVWHALQKAGLIRMIEGGKAHSQFLKETEARIRRELEKENKPPEAIPEEKVESEAESQPKVIAQPVLQFPNATAFTPPEKETMAKEYKMSDLSTEQRDLLNATLKRSPDITYEDLNAKLGFRLIKTVYYSTMYAIKTGKYNFGVDRRGGFQGGGSAAAAPATRGTIPRSPVSTGSVPFVNYSKINAIQILTQIDGAGYTKDEIRFIRTHFPTFLAQVTDTRMQFKIVQYTEDDEENKTEKITLEVRRIA